MKKNLTFINTRVYKRVDVRVGPDPLLLAAGAVALVVKVWELIEGEHIRWYWWAASAVLAHAMQWRHVLTLPVLGSAALAVMSSGVSPLITGVVINKLVAQRYRNAGWKIRNTDGELGEYSSRFLAVDELGFRESDLLASATPAQVKQPSNRRGVPVSTFGDLPPEGRRPRSAAPESAFTSHGPGVASSGAPRRRSTVRTRSDSPDTVVN